MQETISLAKIKLLAQSGNIIEAESLLKSFLGNLFELNIKSIKLRKDSISLNSVNGFLYLKDKEKKSDSEVLFFKFHQEENEEEFKEYYNSNILIKYGFPIEKPLYYSTEVGKQVLIYNVKDSERFFDVCKRLDFSDNKEEIKEAVSAQEDMDRTCCQKYLDSLHEVSLKELKEEPIFQLFTKRLTDDFINEPYSLGSKVRYGTFYDKKNFRFPGGTELNFDKLKNLKWIINDVEYSNTLGEAFQGSLEILSLYSDSHASASGEKPYAAVVAHGDAHNGNLWYNKDSSGSFLSFFDPAFAGEHIPVLLAEIKATFHNIFAHPFWLYDSETSDKLLNVSCKITDDDYIIVKHDWEITSLRRMFLESKRDNFWSPLIKALKNKNMLSDNWEQYIRAGLFCCPSLVMNLRAGCGTKNNSHTEKTSLLGFSNSLMLYSKPVNNKDLVSEFFDVIKNYSDE